MFSTVDLTPFSDAGKADIIFFKIWSQSFYMDSLFEFRKLHI